MLKRQNKKSKSKFEAVLQLLLFLLILVIANVISSYLRTQIDLTEDGRFSLTKGTKAMLKNLEEQVSIEIYLEGDFPARFKRLQNSVSDLLTQFDRTSGQVNFEFIDPLTNVKPEEYREVLEDMKKHGLIPINLGTVDARGKSTRQLVFTQAKITYQGKSGIINLLENKIPPAPGQSPEDYQEWVINSSVNMLEYKFANALQKIQSISRPNIIFTKGHGELDSLETLDLQKTLKQFYTVGYADLRSVASVRKGVSMMIVAKPRLKFSEKEKFKLDQYVMNGGKVIWLVDNINAELDSLGVNPSGYVPFPYELNLEDQFFKYGVRFNQDLIQDLQSSSIPMVSGKIGDQVQTEMQKWYYHPIAFSDAATHPIVRNIDGVDLRYPSTIDTIRTKIPSKKTILLKSSEYSKNQRVPVPISFNILAYEPEPKRFNKPNLPLAVLIEGRFESVFKNLVAPEMLEGLKQLGTPYKDLSEPTGMIFVADGDVARNDFDRRTGQPLGLGYNRFEQYTYGNKDFLLNCIEYLLDKDGIISARSKEVKIRLLDKVRAQEEKSYWQFLNLGMPLIFLVLFGWLYYFIRKKRFGI